MLLQQTSRIHGKNIQALFVLYLFSNLLLLLNTNGIYWDDWVLYNQPFDEIKDMMNQLTGKAHLFEYIHRALSLIGNGVFSYRLATVVLYFISGLFLYFTLLDIKSIPRQSVFYITLLFMIFPVNSARVALCDVQYGLFLCVFFMAFWLLTHYLSRPRNLFFRATVLALFYLSFFVNSLLVFYAIVLLYILYKVHLRSPSQSWASCTLIFFVRYMDFIGLPILFYCIKTAYFVPYGLYQHYNALSNHYLTIALDLMKSSKHAFYEPLAQTVWVSLQFWYVLGILMIFLAIYLQEKNPFASSIKEASVIISPPVAETRNDGGSVSGETMTKATKEDLSFFSTSSIMRMMGLGLLFFIIAVFPYIAIGKMPVLFSFDSRHMLLIPLSIALILYAAILLIERKNTTLAHCLLVALIASCILKNMHDQTQYLKDWMYQVALEEHYKTNVRIKNNTTFLLNSNVSLSNHRGMDFYENNGRLRKVFGDDKRFMAGSLNEIQTYANYKPYKRYNFSSWTPSTPLTVTVRKEIQHDLTIKPFLKLLVYMLHNDIAFRHEAKTLITMDVS